MLAAIIDFFKTFKVIYLEKRTFKVKLSNAWAGLRYFEGGKEMFIDSEMRGGKWLRPQMAISKRSIKGWKPPHENEVVSDLDKKRILDNIVDFYQRSGYTIIIE